MDESRSQIQNILQSRRAHHSWGSASAFRIDGSRGCDYESACRSGGCCDAGYAIDGEGFGNENVRAEKQEFGQREERRG